MKKLFILTLVSMLTLSCGMPKRSELEFDEGNTTPLNLDPDEKVDFAMLKTKILAPKCLSCHSEASTEKGIIDWVVPGKPESSPMFVKSENGSMPKNGKVLSTPELELMSMYINQLVPTTPATPSSPPVIIKPPVPPTPEPGKNPGITYDELKDKILSPYRCLNCHSLGTESKMVKWINTTSPVKSRLYTITKSGVMPQGGSDVSAADQAFILQYLENYSSR